MKPSIQPYVRVRLFFEMGLEKRTKSLSRLDFFLRRLGMVIFFFFTTRRWLVEIGVFGKRNSRFDYGSLGWFGKAGGRLINGIGRGCCQDEEVVEENIGGWGDGLKIMESGNWYIERLLTSVDRFTTKIVKDFSTLKWISYRQVEYFSPCNHSPVKPFRAGFFT